MGNAVIKRTIKIETELSALKKLEAELQAISKQGNQLNLTGHEQEKLLVLLKDIERLKARMSELGGDDMLVGNKEFITLSKELDKIISKTNTLSNAFLKLVPQDLQDKIKGLQDELNALTDSSRSAGAAKGRAKRDLNRQRNQVTAEIAGPELGISNYDTLVAKYEEIDQAADNLTPEQKQLVDVFNQVTEALKEQTAQYDAIVAKQDALLEKNRQLKASKQEELSQYVQQGAQTILQVDPNASQAYNQITSANTELQNSLDRTKKSFEEQQTASVNTATKTEKYKTVLSSTTAEQDKNTKSQQQLTNQNIVAQSTWGRAAQNVFSYQVALRLFRNIAQKAVSTITEMDEALTGMTVVTSLTREQAWALTGELQNLAKQTGMTTTEVANMTTMYLQQGKTLSESLELTKAAAMAARIAGISGSESINLLTNAMNGFQMSASQAMEVSDKFAALAASAATDYEELATALSKVAAQANLAGMSMDFTLGLLTKGIEVTREAPETIGTALKTVISRMRELTDYGATLEDGIDVNRVDKALQNIGVSLLDDNNQFRDLELVLTEVGEKWDTLNTNQQANVAVALAGTRQQSRLIAMMQDFDRTQQLVNISMNSAGATAAQHKKYMQGLEAAITKVTTSYQQLITTFVNSDAVVGAVNILGQSLEFIGNNTEIVYVGLGLITTALIANSTEQLMHNAITAASTVLLGLNKKAIEEARVADAQRTQTIQKGIIVQEQQKIAELESTLATEQQILSEKQLQVAWAQGIVDNQKRTIASREASIAKWQSADASLAEAHAEAIASNNMTKAAMIEAKRIENNKHLYKAESLQTKAKIQLAQSEAKLATKKQELAAAEINVATIEQELGQSRLNLTHALAAASVAASIIINKGKGQSIALTVEQILTEKLRTAGLHESTAAEVAKNIVSKTSNILSAAGILLNIKSTKEQKAEARAKLASGIASLFKAGADTTATGATIGLTGATHGFSNAIKSVPLIGWILAIIALVIALIQAAYEMGAFTEAIEALKGVGEALMNILNALFNVIGTILKVLIEIAMPTLNMAFGILNWLIIIIEYIVEAVNFVIQVINAVMLAVQNLLKTLLSFLDGGGRVTQWMKDAGEWLKKGLDSMKKWCNGFIDSLSRTFETAEDRSKRYADEVIDAQEKIYDAQQDNNTLKPLLDEYEQLSKKAIKSAEDLERLEAIKDEIGQIDKELVNEKTGEVQWSKVQDRVEENNKAIAENTQKAYESAIGGILTGDYGNDETFASGLATYYTQKLIANDEYDATTASNIANNLETAFKNLDYDALRDKYANSMYNSLADGIGAGFKGTFDEYLAAEMDGVAQSIEHVTAAMSDEGATISSNLDAFMQEYAKLGDVGKEALGSIFTYYAELLNMMEGLQTEGDKATFKKNLEALGLSEEQYLALQSAHMGDLTRREGESDEDYNKRVADAQASWNEYFSNALTSVNNADSAEARREVLVNLVSGQDQAVVNEVLGSIIGSNQSALEQYAKQTSSFDNLEEGMKKAKAGTLTLDEMRTLMEENADIFADQSNVDAFMRGEFDLDSYRNKATEELKNSLLDTKAVIEEIKSDSEEWNSLTDEQRANYNMQLNLIDAQLNSLQYAYWYNSEIWKQYAEQTKEQQKQIRQQAELNRIEKEMNKLNENDEKYAENKLKLLAQQEAIYKQQKDDAQTLLENDIYKKAKNAGVYEVVDGEVIFNADKVKSSGLTDAEVKWLEENDERLKEASTIVNEWEEKEREILDERRSVIEEEYNKQIEALEKRQEQYEEYWDTIDKLEEEEDRQKSREDITSQLSALAGASDGKSKSMQKELLQQLQEINEEEEEARKQEIRDAITKSIDDHVESIDNKISKLPTLTGAELATVLADLGYDMSQYKVVTDPETGKISLQAYKTGGLVDYTGPAWLDGTPTKPERVLSAPDTKALSALLHLLVHKLEIINDVDTDESVAGIVIENINIHTDHLDDNQDFRSAGNIFATEFAKVINKRGINVNVKK